MKKKYTILKIIHRSIQKYYYIFFNSHIEVSKNDIENIIFWKNQIYYFYTICFWINIQSFMWFNSMWIKNLHWRFNKFILIISILLLLDE